MNHSIVISGTLLASCAAIVAASVPSVEASPGGTPGIWQPITLVALNGGDPAIANGDTIQSIVADPVNPGVFYAAAGNNDGRKIKWLRTTDFGDTWIVRNETAMNGSPWGFSIDPNPARAPGTLPTLYSPAGYGSLGAWKSTDGALTWTRLAGADTAFGPYNPYGATLTDLYHVAVLPDDPPRHVLATYHYGFKDSADGGFGESTDGGLTWVVHPPPPGIGTSHYVLPISATTWCVIAQSNDGNSGIWRTTTAGRLGGTAALNFRDGTISAAAWTKVSGVEHVHGSFQAWKTPDGTWYAPGWTSIAKSTDQGASWVPLVSGNWPGTFNGVNTSAIVATARYLYANSFVETTQARAPIGSDMQWDRAYSPPTTANGANPYGTSVAYAASIGSYVILMGDHARGIVWRYIEPAPDALFADGFDA
ncbi:MAG: hypothetical protein ABI411_14250 [Tahibacter sp.]